MRFRAARPGDQGLSRAGSVARRMWPASVVAAAQLLVPVISPARASMHVPELAMAVMS
jgi:hypothetical protein